MTWGNAIALGNLSIDDLLKRTGYNMTQQDIDILKAHLQENATIDPFSDKFHIFDVPFNIVVGSGFKKQLVSILMKYEEISPSKEPLQINEAIESEKEREQRLKREKEDAECKERDENPNSIWNIKWHMMVPVVINGKDYFYGCFINTYTKGKQNIPDMIYGRATVCMDEDGLSGRFTLDNPETDNDSEEYSDFNYVIGSGLYNASGKYLGTRSTDYTFDCVEFSISECLENTKRLSDKFIREIHFHKYAE